MIKKISIDRIWIGSRRPHEKDPSPPEIKNVKERDIKIFSEEDQKLYANKFFKDERNLERILKE